MTSTTTPDYMNAITADYDFAVIIAKLMFGATRRAGKAGLTISHYYTADGDDVVIQRIEDENGHYVWKVGFFNMQDMKQVFPATTVTEQPAPVDPSSLALDSATPDYSEGYQDGVSGNPHQPDRFGLYSAGYVDGQADALATDDLMTNDTGLLRVQLTDADAEITRLNRIIEGLQADLHICERKVKAAQDAADNAATAALAEIEQLTADKARAATYRQNVADITHDLMGVDLTDTQAVGELINALWRL